jgi:hypothetical protein
MFLPLLLLLVVRESAAQAPGQPCSLAPKGTNVNSAMCNTGGVPCQGIGFLDSMCPVRAHFQMNFIYLFIYLFIFYFIFSSL